jgi:phospholipid/cholesterol/gamma-HCH transport system ATP-binding protein
MMPPEQEVMPGVEESSAAPAIASSGGKSDGAAVVLRGLHKSFGSQIVLDGIDLTVGSGKTLAVLGRSGTGKSVLLKLIIGLQKPDSGSVDVHGQEITRLPLDALNEIRK